MNSSSKFIKPPSEEYGDDVLYGERRDATKLIEIIKLGNNSECVMYPIGTFVDKKQWSIKNIIGLDKRIKAMMNGMGISHALPLQRYCWPQMYRSTFPFVCVSPESTGKTFTYLLYIVSRCITAIPISKTDEIILGSNHSNSFKTSESSNTKIVLPHGISLDDKALSEVNQDEFDFNSLGKDVPPGNHVDSREGEKTRIENRANDCLDPIDAWGLKSKDHYEVNAENFITHPSDIIICSSQQQVEEIDRDIEQMKSSAYGELATGVRLKNLPPIVRTINVHQDEDKLALRCNEGEILITTPGALIRCFNSNYITFARCKRVFFDNLDLTLQLHNFNVREIIKRYLIQTQFDELALIKDNPTIKDSCQMYLFSQKWTDLVKQFVGTVFLQKTLIFGSIVEASLYANLRYELEIYTDINLKMTKLLNLVKLHANGESRDEKVAIVCRTNQEAEEISIVLNDLSHSTKFLHEQTAISSLKSKPTGNIKTTAELVYVMSDSALEFIVDFLNDVAHIIHYSFPDEMLVFDQRFRLMYKHITDLKRKIMTTIFISTQFNTKHAKELFDMISRSSTTLNSTKLEMRDFISDNSKTICWRWASSGLCRLEKLSRDDRFGSYCPDRHSITTAPSEQSNGCRKSSRWPKGGQIKITITHLVSPNEFYFWFEAHRDKNSRNKEWTKLKSTGSDYMKELQKKLDKYKNTPSCSIPLSNLKKGKIYAIYLQQEARVDRIVLIEEPKIEIADTNGLKKNGMLYRFKYHLEYSKQSDVLKIDYGVRISVYLRNIFEIPETLSSIEAQCHRGFHLGVKPTDSEPNWLYKAKKHFYDNVCVNNLHDITVWLRLNSNNCFWFEHMIVTRKLSNIDGNRYFNSEPYRELCKAQLADRTVSEPSCLNPSDRLSTLSKWNVDQSALSTQYAFLRGDKDTLDIFVLHIHNNLDLMVRQIEFNKQLIKLEERMMEDYNNEKVRALNYYAIGVLCIVRIQEGTHPKTKEPIYTLNRCKITGILKPQANQDLLNDNENKYVIECLDHGDLFEVNKTDLYQAATDYLSQLPYQAIKCKLADLNLELLEDKNLSNQTRELLYDYTRHTNDQLKSLKCRFNSKGEMYIYIPVDGKVYAPLINLLEVNNKIKICNNNNPDIRETVTFTTTTMRDPIRDGTVEVLISEILGDIIKQELFAVGVKINEDELDSRLLDGIKELKLEK